MSQKNQGISKIFKGFSPKIIIVSLLGVMVFTAFTGYFLWQAEVDKRKYRGASVEVTRVRQGSIERKINAVGSLTANESVVIKPQVSGTIKEIHFKGGDVVSKEDVLVTIDDKLYAAQLKEAQAQLTLAKINYDRKKKLFEQNAGAKAKLDEAQAQLGTAEAKVELAQHKLNQARVKAPFDGITGIKLISIGDSVNEQKELLSFVDVDPMKIDFKVPANYVQLLSVNQKVVVFVDGFGTRKFEATIEEIDARIDPQTHSLAIRATIPNKRGLLKPGLFGRVRLVAGSQDNTLLVPSVAVEVSGDEEYVYRVVERRGYQLAERVVVTTGIKANETTEIVRGLKDGDIVITSGHVKIQDYSIVRPIGLEEDEDDKDDDEEKGDEKDKDTKEEPQTDEDEDTSSEVTDEKASGEEDGDEDEDEDDNNDEDNDEEAADTDQDPEDQDSSPDASSETPEAETTVEN